MKEKYLHNPPLREALLATGTDTLVERVGSLLQEIRTELRDTLAAQNDI